MKTDKFIRRILPAVLLGALLAGAVSCGGDKGGSEDPVAPATLTLRTNPVTSEVGSQSATIHATGAWTLSSDQDWLTVCPLKAGEARETAKRSLSGTGDATIVYYYTINPGEDARTATLTLKSGSNSVSVVLTQKGLAKINGQKTAKVGWLELPQTDTDDNKYFFTHDMTLGSKSIRNYSFYWDYSNLVSWWVAYPLNAALLVKNLPKRSDAWGLDPLLPRAEQQVIHARTYTDDSGEKVTRAYFTNANCTNGSGYTKGHQIPSADRLYDYSSNAQTFYGTNMTPQNYDFNGGTWEKLEENVREWAKKSTTDTLYVCTGCVVSNSGQKVYDHDGKPVAVPTAYFKALLVHEKSSSHSFDATGGYSSCAFFFDHAEYSVSGKSGLSKAEVKELAISVEELEKKLGYKLFVNLPDKIGADKASTVKKTDPKTVSWWK